MDLDRIIFYDSLPKVDLHGLTKDEARVKINDFIYENKVLKNKIFLIIHGVGTKALKKTTHEVLKQNKQVLEYKLQYNNLGCTVVLIKID